MKIIKIDVITNENCLTFDDSSYLCPVIVTARKWYGVKYTFKAYPTHTGIIGRNGTFLFHYYCNELGEKLSNNMSEQICNYMLSYRMKST